MEAVDKNRDIQDSFITGDLRISWTIKKDALMWVVGIVCAAIGSIATLFVKYFTKT